MTYPLQFRPNQFGDVYDSIGDLVHADRPVQIFRPLISCDFNFTPLTAFNLFNPSTTLMRLAVELPADVSPPLGRTNFNGTIPWQVVLDEDPANRPWSMYDGIRWTSLDGKTIVAAIAGEAPFLGPPTVTAPIYTSCGAASPNPVPHNVWYKMAPTPPGGTVHWLYVTWGFAATSIKLWAREDPVVGPFVTAYTWFRPGTPTVCTTPTIFHSGNCPVTVTLPGENLTGLIVGTNNTLAGQGSRFKIEAIA